MRTKFIFYRTETGQGPVQEFLDTLSSTQAHLPRKGERRWNFVMEDTCRCN